MVSVKKKWEEVVDKLLHIYDLDEAKSIAYVLFEDVFGVTKAEILADHLKEIEETELQKCIERLRSNEPIQHIVGFTYFLGRRFKVNSDVLIPRQETEELVQLIINEYHGQKPKILDIGVGSGCIAISLSLELEINVFGTDVSDKALEIAQSNALTLGAEVDFFHNNILKDKLELENLDVIVSNPPYIPELERSLMHENVTKFDPGIALFVPNDDPFVFYRQIAIEGKRILKKGGELYFEIHENFGDDIKHLITELGYERVIIHQDLAGKDRILSATK